MQKLKRSYFTGRNAFRYCRRLFAVAPVFAALALSSGAEASSILASGADGLSVGYETFKTEFFDAQQHEVFGIGYASSPMLVSEEIDIHGFANITQPINGATARVEARVETSALSGVPLQLYLVKNVAGAGRSAKPESGDLWYFLGEFVELSTVPLRTLEADLPADLAQFMDFDTIVVVRGDQPLGESVLAAGSQSIFEKRFFREAYSLPLPSYTPADPQGFATLDPLVHLGAELFFDETFDGNGRTCGTCHRKELNLTIDAEFIATLDPTIDPLFVHRQPHLNGLEDDQLLVDHALIKENLDGFAPEQGHVMRSVQHTFALSDSIYRNRIPFRPGFEGDTPPDQRTGWSGDGAPGRGTLHEFALGAIFQHLPDDLNREVGDAFRIPTQEELDALEAFQLFTGRQREINVNSLTFNDQRLSQGRDMFNRTDKGACLPCHTNAGSNSTLGFNNLLFDTGVESRDFPGVNLPPDGGFGRAKADPTQPGFGNGRFNVPSLIEAADTAPFFHNNSAATLEDAIRHYTSEDFQQSEGGSFFQPTLTDSEVDDLAAFLRGINALENMRQVRERIDFVIANLGANPEPSTTILFDLAIKDCDDAIKVLEESNLHTDARHHIADARQTLVIARVMTDASRPPFLDWAKQGLQRAKDAIIDQNPESEF